jgi:hypothetical protein
MALCFLSYDRYSRKESDPCHGRASILLQSPGGHVKRLFQFLARNQPDQRALESVLVEPPPPEARDFPFEAQFPSFGTVMSSFGMALHLLMVVGLLGAGGFLDSGWRQLAVALGCSQSLCSMASAPSRARHVPFAYRMQGSEWSASVTTRSRPGR